MMLFELFIKTLAVLGFVGVFVWFVVIMQSILHDMSEGKRPSVTGPPDEQTVGSKTHRYIELPDWDPRNPAYPALASQEYDSLFGRPRTPEQTREKNRTILGWAFLAFDWMVSPPQCKPPQLTRVEAAWFYCQLEKTLDGVPKSAPKP